MRFEHLLLATPQPESCMAAWCSWYWRRAACPKASALTFLVMQVEHMLANGHTAGLQIAPVPGSLPPLLRPGARRVDAPPFQLDFELCMQKLRCQVQLRFPTLTERVNNWGS